MGIFEKTNLASTRKQKMTNPNIYGMTVIKNLLAIILAGIVSAASGTVVIDRATKVEMSITDPIPAEKTAEQELRTYLEKIFGKHTPAAADKKIILKYDEKLGKEEFCIKSQKDGSLTISGGRPRGVLYGVYWFLDRKLGVHWLTPSVEYVPSKTSVDLGDINHIGKPAFASRLLLCTDHRFAARNLINVNSGSSKYPQEYGFEKFFGPNGFAHNLCTLVPPMRFFKTHPDIYALQRGKRRHGNATGVTASYCLTNPKLAELVIIEARKYLQAHPETTYFGIEEGDFTEGNCTCENCKAAELKYGKRVGGCWIEFANRVSGALKKEFPHVIFKTFAYLSSKKPPVNIKANENVAVHYCAWGQRFGLAYTDPRNQSGQDLIKDIKGWEKVADHILIWDYVACMGSLMSNADNLQNIDNMKLFRDLGAEGVFPEGSAPEDIGVCGAAFRSWLLARAMWNPDECQGEELERTFCKEFFGEKAGAKIAEYYKTYRDVNKKEGFWKFTMAGPLSGTPKFMSPEVTAKVYKLVKKAYALADTPEHKNRVQNAMTNIQFLILRNYNDMKKANLIDESYDSVEKSLWDFLKANASAYRINNNFSKQIKPLRLRYKIKATAQAEYASIAQFAYDGDVNTAWHYAGPKAWCQIEFPEVREISRITTVLDNYGTVESHYKIAGSLDGKEWFELVPPRFEKGDDFKGQFIYADDKLEKPVKVKFVRTYRTGSKLPNTLNDALLYEQAFNLKEIPADFKKPVQSTRRRTTLLIPYTVKDFTPRYNNFSYFDSEVTENGLISNKSIQFASVFLFRYDKPIKVTIEFESKDGAMLYVGHESKAKTPRNISSDDFPVISIYIPKEDQERMRSSLKLMNLTKRGHLHVKSIKVEDASENDRIKYEKDLKDWNDAFQKNQQKNKNRAAAPGAGSKAEKAAKQNAVSVLSIPAEIKFAETPGVRVVKGTVVDKDGVLSNNNAGRFMIINLPASENALKITMKVHTADKSLLGILHDNRLQKLKRASYGWGSRFDYMQTHTFTIPAERLKTQSELSFFRVNKNPGEIKIKEMKVEAVK